MPVRLLLLGVAICPGFAAEAAAEAIRESGTQMARAEAVARDAEIVRYALSAPATVEADSRRLAAYLQGVGDHPRERARALFVWIAERIDYDWAGREAGTLINDAETAWNERKAVCGGFAELYRNLGRHMGLQVETVLGVARGTGSDLGHPLPELNHAWNAVWWDGRWHLVDVTWGSPHGDRGQVGRQEEARREDFYFDVDPAVFISTHHPQESRWQLLPEPIARSAFADSARWWPAAFGHRFEFVDYAGAEWAVSGPGELVARASPSARLVARLSRLDGDEPLAEGHAFVLRRGAERRIRVSPPTAGRYLLRIYGREGRGEETTYQALVAIQVDAERPANVERYPVTRAGFNDFGAEVAAPVVDDLRAGKQAVFRVRVPGAARVSVVNAGVWTALRPLGGWFVGALRPRAGRAVVVASGQAEGGQHQALLVYTVAE